MATIIRQSYIDKIERYLGKETVIVSSDWAHSVFPIWGFFLFSGTPNPSSFCIHTLLYRVIVNSAAKLQSGGDKNWHREKKRWRGEIKLQMKYIRQKVPSPANVVLFLCWSHVCLQLCLLPYFLEKLLKKFYGCMQAHEEEYSSGSVS